MSKNSIPTHMDTLQSKMGIPVLRIGIGGGEDIDLATRNAIVNRLYKVVAWVVRGQEFVTQLVEGKLDPIWNRRFEVFIDPALLSSTVFLHVEVIRASSDEPGTSRNSAVVGRARIPLPKLNGAPPPSYRRYGLTVAHGCDVHPGGHIYILMEIRGHFTEE